MKNNMQKFSRFLAFLCIIVFFLSAVTSCTTKSKKSKIHPPPQPPPQYITFGGLNWRVLERDEQNNRVLIISQDLIGVRAYHEGDPYDLITNGITWEYCTLRAYLNDEFYHSFSAADQARIQTALVSNPDHPIYGTPGGNPTSDKVFLLSLTEAQTYFASNEERIATIEAVPNMWWLRSPGYDAYYAASVNYGGGIGVVGINVYTSYGGVRPALWLNL